MNRTLLFGIALFFAVVGLALVGTQSTAVAGHGCHKCCSAAAASCSGDAAGDCSASCCHKHHKRCCHERHHRCHKCCSGGDCSAAADCGCGGEPAKEAPKDAKEAPKSTSVEDGAPLAFHAVSFVR
ncbi:MAG: hypothetical protein K8T25_15150 [Planctomycetia bacterium]|nr:hypothetical protein [Planctomycetia bacterium]